MKFRKGNKVEVSRREHDDPYGSWVPANIIYSDGERYIIRYGLLENGKERQVMEKVSRKDVRPQPRCLKKERWTAGDLVEVFDTQCWRVGKVAKVLQNKQFVMRLFGSIKLEVFHESNVRIRQAWHNNKWSVIGKVARDKRTTNNFMQKDLKHPGSLVSRSQSRVKVEVLESRDEDGQEHIKERHGSVQKFVPQRTMKRLNGYYFEPFSKDLLAGGNQKRRKTSTCKRSLTTTLPPINQVDDISPSKLKLDAKLIEHSNKMDDHIEKGTTDLLHTCYRRLHSSEDSDRCSVASCSSNDLADFPSPTSSKSLENMSDNSDAESSFPSWSSKRQLRLSLRHRLEVDIHELELCAYRTTMQALYASGPLSWDQESLLTNLRLSLNISDEEHLLELRLLLSDQVR